MKGEGVVGWLREEEHRGKEGGKLNLLYFYYCLFVGCEGVGGVPVVVLFFSSFSFILFIFYTPTIFSILCLVVALLYPLLLLHALLWPTATTTTARLALLGDARHHVVHPQQDTRRLDGCLEGLRLHCIPPQRQRGQRTRGGGGGARAKQGKKREEEGNRGYGSQMPRVFMSTRTPLLPSMPHARLS